MSEVKWIKIVTDIFDDEKILLIESMPDADSIIVIWFKLLCLAGKNNNNGVFLLNERIHYTDEMFATIFRRNLNTVRMALKTFEEFGMIEIINDTVTIPNWGKHQKLDALEAKTTYQREYMRNYRAKQRELVAGKTNGKTNDNDNGNANVSVVDKIRLDEKRIESNTALQGNSTITEGNGNADNSRKRERFTPPTISEVEAYAKEKGYTSQEFSPSYFVDFYQSKGWKVGRDPMKDWKASVRMWVARYRHEHPAPKQEPEKPHGLYSDNLSPEELMRRQKEQAEKDREEARRQGLL